ncbi:glycosyltransferase family 2 protein [bacterium]|nr:glycosyltransferase family 2 protein [bacterium]
MSTSDPDAPVALSVVIPLYNEEESLPHLQQEIANVCAEHGITWEVIYVDDGSSDSSFSVLEKMHQRDSRIKVLQFRSNCGKSDALSAGFKEAAGRYVITMDADLQDDPHEIPRLIARLEEGFDLVSGWKKKRRDPVSKRWPSKFFNRVTGLLSGVRLHDFNCGLKIYRNEVVKTVHVYGELHRYIPVLAALEGFRVGELVVNHRPRQFGRTKFGAARFFRGPLDLITVLFLSKYMRRPLHLFGGLGFVVSLAGLGITAYLVVMRVVKQSYLSNRPILFIGVLLTIVGIQFISLGLLGEMLTKMNASRHIYSIRKKLGD